jgi:hypothetical protein
MHPSSDLRAGYEGELCNASVAKDHRAGLSVAIHRCRRDLIAALTSQLEI